jgi:hypothetical protein
LLLIYLGASLLLSRRAGMAPVDESVSLDGASSAAISLRHGTGELIVGAGADAGLLYAGSFSGGVEKRLAREGDRLEVTLTSPDQDWTQWIGPWGRRSQDWDLRLSRDVPISLAVETGASSNRLDLSELRVTDLRLQTGASASRLILPARAGPMRARLDAGAASVDVVVPTGVAARISGAMGVGALDVDERRFPRRGSGYESPDFEMAENRVELDVQGGVGRVSVV